MRILTEFRQLRRDFKHQEAQLKQVSSRWVFEKHIWLNGAHNALLNLFVVFKCDFELFKKFKNTAVAATVEVLLVFFGDLEKFVIQFCFAYPVFLDHFEKHMGA